MTSADNTGQLRDEKALAATTGLELGHGPVFFRESDGQRRCHRMPYSAAQRCFEANVIQTPLPDVQTNIALNLSKGLSELTISLAADIQDLHTQLRALRKELDDLKADRRRLNI